MSSAVHLLPWIAAGGAVGAVLRFAVGMVATDLLGPRLPWGTLIVNVVGSFVLGLLLEWGERVSLGPGIRALLGTGLLGAFTTFSTFSVETVRLLQRGDLAGGLGNAAANLALSVVAAALGIAVLRATLGVPGPTGP